MRAVGELAADVPAGAHVVADIYVRWAGQPDADAMAARLGEVITAQPLPERVDRITTTVAGGGRALMHHHFTFRRGAAGASPAGTSPAGAVLAGFGEDRLIRGLHPRIAERMQLERLREFDLTRLPSADEEVYLFQCVAQANPADERLVAMAQVRDLTPLREADGRLAALPAVEDALAACLDAIRIVQAQRPAEKRFDTNRIVIYVWPPNELTTDELTMDELDLIAQRVLPTTAGAGLEEVLFLARRPNPETGEPVGPGRDDPRRRRRRRPPLGGPAVGRAGAAAGRLPAEGAARGAPRHRVPLRAHRDAGRRGQLRRARPRRRGRAGAGGPAAGQEHRQRSSPG